MIVSNSTLLNILLPNENKALKEVLKEADNKSLSSSKSTNLQDILKNLFDNLKSKTKSTQSINNLLKNSSVFKDLGSFPKDLESLIKNLPTDGQNEKMTNLKNTLQSALVNIKDLDEGKLKELVQKSGIFLESKIANSLNTSLNPNSAKLNELLTQIKELIQNDTRPKTKELTALIDKMIASNNNTKISPTLNSEIKQAITLLKEIAQQPSSLNSNKIIALTNQLENMNSLTKVAESKIQNNILTPLEKTAITNEMKPVLSNLKAELINSKNPIFTPIIKQIDALLQSNDMFSKNTTTAQPKALMEQLVQSPVMNKAMQEVPKIGPLLTQLNTQIQNLEKLENNILKGQINPTKIQELQSSIKQTLGQLQTALTEMKSTDAKGITQVIDKLMNMQNLFSKLEIPQSIQQQSGNQVNQNIKNQNTQKTEPLTMNSHNKPPPNETTKGENVSLRVQNTQNTNMQESKPLLSGLNDNLKSIITAIKSSIIQLHTSQQGQAQEGFNPFEVSKSITKLETLFQSKFENIQNQLLQNTKNPVDSLQNDIKSALLQLQDESIKNPKLQDLTKNIEKLLTHIDYYQLLSVTSSSNYLYVPFIWDMLEDGSVSMKKLKEDHYFCEIHLTLKEFGNMDLLLGLYDENSLDISVFSNQPFVKNMIQEHLIELKVGLNRAGLVPQNIKILDLKEEKELKKEPSTIYKSPYNSNDVGFGVDIKV